MQLLNYNYNFSNYCNAFNAVLCFLKIFKYLAISPKLGMLNRVVANIVGDFTAFMFMYLIILSGFTLAFYIAYGNNIKDFNSFKDCCLTLFMWSLGAFDFEELKT